MQRKIELLLKESCPTIQAVQHALVLSTQYFWMGDVQDIEHKTVSNTGASKGSGNKRFILTLTVLLQPPHWYRECSTNEYTPH